MLTACNTPSLKNSVLKSFGSETSRLRIVFATVAFGMGVDVPGIRRIIHWSFRHIKTYIQETGHAGRDGKIAYAKLYFSKKDLSLPFMEESIKSYCTNKQCCRREILFKDFDHTSSLNKPVDCKCCDICSILCKCDDCIN